MSSAFSFSLSTYSLNENRCQKLTHPRQANRGVRFLRHRRAVPRWGEAVTSRLTDQTFRVSAQRATTIRSSRDGTVYTRPPLAET